MIIELDSSVSLTCSIDCLFAQGGNCELFHGCLCSVYSNFVSWHHIKLARFISYDPKQASQLLTVALRRLVTARAWTPIRSQRTTVQYIKSSITRTSIGYLEPSQNARRLLPHVHKPPPLLNGSNGAYILILILFDFRFCVGAAVQHCYVTYKLFHNNNLECDH